MEEILLLRIGFDLEMRRLSCILRSNLELPDMSIVKSQSQRCYAQRDDGESEQPTFARLKAYF